MITNKNQLKTKKLLFHLTKNNLLLLLNKSKKVWILEKLPERITKQKLTENSIKTEKLTVKKNKPNQTKQKKITSRRKNKVKKVLTLSQNKLSIFFSGLKEISNTNSNDSIKIIKLIKTYHSQIVKRLLVLNGTKLKKKQNNLKIF